MDTYYQLRTISFFPLVSSSPKFFGFSEFLVGLALIVIAWTNSDIRYRFRIRIAPLPLKIITFAVVTFVGILTLLTDFCRAEEWLIPQGFILTPASWQAFLGGLFFFTFMVWAWFAFIRPPIYGKLNAKQYAQTLYQVILKGSPEELAVIADEFAHSAKSLILNATNRVKDGYIKEKHRAENTPIKEPLEVTALADEILLLIADKRFCRAIVESSPGTAWVVFHEIVETKKYGVQVETFAKNIVNEALTNRESFLFHETEGYESGLIGYIKPLSQAMFSNHEMVETVGTLLELDLNKKRKLDSRQLEAYCRIVLITFRDCVVKGCWYPPSALYGAKDDIENGLSDLYKLDGATNIDWDDEVYAKLRVVVDYIKNAVEILDQKGVPAGLQRRIRETHQLQLNFYYYLASMIFEVIFHASAVRTPAWRCWQIQHNSLWGELFSFHHMNGPAAKIVRFMVRRLIYDEIVEMTHSPDFKRAKYLRFCLNVLGLKGEGKEYHRDSRALQKVVLSWTKKNYAWLYNYNPRVAAACLPEGMKYDDKRSRLVINYPVEGLRRKAGHIYFKLDPPANNIK